MTAVQRRLSPSHLLTSIHLRMQARSSASDRTGCRASDEPGGTHSVAERVLVSVTPAGYITCLGKELEHRSVMMDVTTSVLATVNAPYGANLSAQQLAAKIVDPASLAFFDAPVFAFFSEVKEGLQHQFIDIMGVDHDQAHWMANQFAIQAGYALPLAA